MTNYEQSIKKLEKVIAGSKQVIDVVDDKRVNINLEKCIRACMSNSIILAEELKNIIENEYDYYSDENKSSASNSSDENVDVLKNLFGFK